MKVLLTGATGYIGRRLLPKLEAEGHKVICLARSAQRLNLKKEQVIEGDLLKPETLQLPEQIDAAFYLVHSMKAAKEGFDTLDAIAAKNFLAAIEKTQAKQIIYLSGIVDDRHLSKHLSSRRQVEEILQKGKIPVTVFRSGIIIGSGSASFEIIRDLTEKLPIMVAPKWINQKCQPIAIYDVLDYLCESLGNEKCMGKTFEIGGKDVLTYKEAMLAFAKLRGLHRTIITVPVLTPNLSALWLIFVTSVNFALARSLIEGVKSEAIQKDLSIHEAIPKECLSYEEAIKRAFAKIQESSVISSWKDSFVFSSLSPDLHQYVAVPEHGCLSDIQTFPIQDSEEATLKRIWTIGGTKGWYGLNLLWWVRGKIDKAFGGVGLRRGRRDPEHLRCGDTLDFWRVILADQEHKRLLLYAEMRLPGEAWLEFQIENNALHQKAIFRPKGVWGRLYWLMMLPFHFLIFRKMAKNLAGYS